MKEGELIEDRSVPFSRGMFMYADGTRELYTITEGLRPDSLGQSPDSTVRRLVQVASGDTTRLARLALVPPKMARFTEPCRFVIGITPLFAPTLVWDAAADRVAVNDSCEYRIEVRDFDGESLTVTRPIEPRPLTRVSGGVRVPHPSVQVGQYRQYLADNHEVFYADPSPIGLSACAYLHNYHVQQDDVILADPFRNG